MKYRVPCFVFAALLASVSALATPVSLSMTASATLEPGTSATNSDSYTGFPDSLNSSAVAYASSGDSYLLSYVETNGWSDDGNSGNILLQSSRNLVGGLNAAYGEPTTFDYYFTADATGDFLLNYSMNLTGSSTFGLNGVYMQFGQPNNPAGQFIWANAGAGQLVTSVVAGELYRLKLELSSNLYGQLAGYDGTLVGLFSFSAPAGNAVPDTTGVMGLMLASVAGLAALRRRSIQS